MKIVSVEAIAVDLPLRTPMKMASKTISVSNNVLAKVTTDTGLVGWGESAAAPKLTGHTQGGIVAGIKHLAPAVMGEDPMARTALWLKMRGAVYGNSSAIAAIDCAIHDIASQAMGVPLFEALGGMVRSEIPVIGLFGSADAKADAKKVIGLHDKGYRWFKLKLGIGSPEVERDTLRLIREAVGDDAVITGDVNTGWDVSTSIKNLSAMAEYDIAFVEQPVKSGDVAGMDAIASQVPIPIGVDEGIHGISDVIAYAPTAVTGVCLKLIKMGGITGVVQGAVTAASLGLEVNLGGKVAETSIASAALTHIAATVPVMGWGISVTHDTTDADVAANPMPIVNGAVTPPTDPGLGINVDEGKVRAAEQYSVTVD